MSRIIALAVAIGAALFGGEVPRSRALEATTSIDLAKNEVGSPPIDFEFLRTGEGETGQWTVVRDATAIEQFAIEHVSTDQHENRFPLAVYRPLSIKNVAVKARLKIIKGTMQAAGIVFRFLTTNSYYVVSANALEQRVDLFRVIGGQRQRIGGVDADIAPDHWQTLELVADNHQFVVSLDGAWLFSVGDSTFLQDGLVGLWTEDDNITRFSQLEITALPWAEER